VNKTPSDLLRLEFNSKEMDCYTSIARYFTMLAATVWREAERFSGKSSTT